MSNKLAKRALASGPVVYQVRGPRDKPTSLSISINYEEAPVPDRYYVANWFKVVERDLEVIISFGDLAEGEDELRSRIDIVFPSLLFVDQLWTSSRDFQTSLSKLLDMVGSKPDTLLPTAKLRTDKLQRLKSNNVFMVVQGTECLLDFFYISPKDMWAKPRRGEPVELEAVVRVMLPPTLLLGLFIESEPIAENLTKRFAGIRRKEETDENLESTHA